VKPNVQQPEERSKTAQEEKTGNTQNDSAKRNVRAMPHNSEKRKRHDAKRDRGGQAGGQAKPGQELRGCVRFRVLHQKRKQIGTKYPERENAQEKEKNEYRVTAGDTLYSNVHKILRCRLPSSDNCLPEADFTTDPQIIKT
jgi:hypothetical protein